MITLGCDPDSSAHGVAQYEGRKLVALYEMTTVELVKHIMQLGTTDIQFSIENVMANSFVYSRNNQATKALQAKIGVSIGRCQQAQFELQQWLDDMEVPYQLHKPQKGNWSNDKQLFERLTGWTGRSNEDTRSAAYFGYLAL